MLSEAKLEVLAAVRERYGRSTRSEKSRILTEVVAFTGYHRKHALRLLRGAACTPAPPRTASRKIYGEAVQEALIVLWEASDRICGKRLKAVLPALLASLERHGRMNLTAEVRDQLCRISAATIDRRLGAIRTKAAGRSRRRPARKIRSEIAVKTFSDWQDQPPGNLEIDFVAHCGDSISGSFIHSLTATDVATGWTETMPLLVREQSLVVVGLKQINSQFPFPVLGINSDNDGAFINESLLSYCRDCGIVFTRARPYRKNDQAWVEQKNGAVVRRFVGYARYTGPVACQVLMHLYQQLRLYVNFFQPSFKLIEKHRESSRIKKRFEPPATPCDRVLRDARVAEDAKSLLRKQRETLDPMDLLYRVRQAQSALAALASRTPPQPNHQRDLDTFLAQLPNLWQEGDARPTHRKEPAGRRYWRTRRDPFEGNWTTILQWLEAEPDATAKSLLERLERQQPGVCDAKQLRTLQRRVKQWRHLMARQLVYGPEDSEKS